MINPLQGWGRFTIVIYTNLINPLKDWWRVTVFIYNRIVFIPRVKWDFEREDMYGVWVGYKVKFFLFDSIFEILSKKKQSDNPTVLLYHSKKEKHQDTYKLIISKDKKWK